MVALPTDVEKVAEYGWLKPGESFHRIFARTPGYLVSTVGGEIAAPHAPLNPVPKCTQEVQEDYRKPSELVATGGFTGDEWVHDKGVRGWATAAGKNQSAVQVADMLTAGNGYAWLVATTHRIAVVIPARFVDLPAEQIPPPAPLPGLNTSLITWWEAPPEAVAGVSDEKWGRTFVGVPFARIDFADSSVLLLRQ